MNLLDARSKLAVALAPVADTDPNVLVDLVDSIEPPALMLGWGDPWLEPDTGCLDWGRLAITCVAGRRDLGAGIATLEELVSYARGRLLADVESWPHYTTSGPRVFTVAGIQWLAARITIRLHVEVV